MTTMLYPEVMLNTMLTMVSTKTMATFHLVTNSNLLSSANLSTDRQTHHTQEQHRHGVFVTTIYLSWVRKNSRANLYPFRPLHSVLILTAVVSKDMFGSMAAMYHILL